MSGLNYQLKRHTEHLGGAVGGKALDIEIEAIDDLDQAINRLCDNNDPNTVRQVFIENLCPYFGVIWPAARAVSEHLARMGGWLEGKTVLELGCGLALPSLVAAKLGAHVTATDFHPDVPQFLERNRALNGLTEKQLVYKDYDWRAAAPLATFDFIIGSDILYEATHPKDVAVSLAKHCASGSHIVLGDPGRVYLQACIDALTGLGFRSDMFVKTVADLHSDRAGDKKTKEVFIFTLQKK